MPSVKGSAPPPPPPPTGEVGNAEPLGAQALHYALQVLFAFGFMLEKAKLSSRYGACPLGIHWRGRVPGPSPQRGPPAPSATGGHLTSSCQARRREARVRATDQNETPTPRSINILQWNAEGAYKKKIALTEKLHKENIDVVCLQETHRKDRQRFTMRGYHVFRHDREGKTKGGVAILVRKTIPAQEFTVSTNSQAEIHGVSIIVNGKQYKIFNICSPPDRDLSLDIMHLQESRCIILGDFNSHSEAWGHEEADRRGEEVENWQDDNGLVLLNDLNDPPTFFSRRRLSSTTPDLAFAANDLSVKTSTTVLSHLGGSGKPAKISLDLQYRTQKTSAFPRWNYKETNWERFSKLVDQFTQKINNKRQNLNTKIKAFNQAVLKAAQESIPRGARKNYKPY